ncbi:LysM peptidoglycan-binding domain-containing protein [Polaribacter porphyrae]|nr:LysM peptidoglycan-binding domain-containing protein [Polaribacter porphyrae]
MKHLKFFIFLCLLTFTVSCGQQIRYIQYKVKEGESVSKIAQKLDMKEKDLIRLNPGIDSLPRANSYIVVPEKKLEEFKRKGITNKEIVSDSISKNDDLIDKDKLVDELLPKFVTYEIKKGDTFYSLKKQFDVTRGELILLNPELTEGLKVGQVLKIKEIIPEVIIDEVFYNDFIDYNTSIKAAILLPFRTHKYQNDTLTLKEIFGRNATLLNIATDFYLGAEVAVDSLRKQGVDIELNVFDTGNRRTNKIIEIISNNNLNENDVVIGPLYSEEVQTVASNVNIPIVFPVYSSNQSSFSSSNIIKTSPDKKVFREELENYFKDNFVEGNIVIVSDGKQESLQNSNYLQSSLSNNTTANTVNIITPQDGYIEKSRFLELLQPETKNWVIIATDDNIIVNDAINSLISLPELTTAKVFTFDKGRVYDKIDNRKLAKLGFTYVSDEYLDTNSFKSRVFTKHYLKKNKALPSFYATKGFDITYDILVRLASGKDLKETFEEGQSARVETKFDYRNSTYLPENKGLFIVQYNEDLTLTKLK